MTEALAAAVPLRAASDSELEERLRDRGVHLRPSEMRVILRRLDRDPTPAELALLDSLWSEHCAYKSTRHLVRRLPTRAPHVVLGPGADAGVVRLPRVGPDGRARLADAGPGGPARCVCIGHESHNHPSQLLPFEGAATGIGGIVRDVYCMGADVIGVLDALRFGDPDGAQADSVRQIARGVVHGVQHYGNALGVPNLGGDVEFDAAFDDNCLVNVVAVGCLDEAEVVPSVAPAAAAREPYVLVLVGKPTDDSGLGGAAFASVVLDNDEGTQQRGAVQLPDPFFKRVLTEANKAVLALLRGAGEPFAMKDLGAAGLGGAASEMAAGAGLGLDLDLDAVHCDEPGRAAAVLLVAETQERYLLAVPEAAAAAVCRVYESDFELGALVRGAGARVIGRFVAAPRLRAAYQGALHLDLPADLVAAAPASAWPSAPRPARARTSVPPASGRDLGADLATLLGSTALASRRPVFGHYDSDVQGRTMLRPGEGDAGVVLLRRDEPLAIAVGLGGAARWGARDAFRAGAAAVCEAARNVAAVGATPWALTDCLNFGSPENPHVMRDLEDAVDGLAAAAAALGVRGQEETPLPFVSGNVSLYNESRAGRAIPPMPIVACLGVVADFARARGLLLARAGDALFRLGARPTCLGGSLYARATGQARLAETDLPALDLDGERARLLALLAAFDAGLVQACHDLGDGGLAVALTEMALGRSGRPALGADIDLGEIGATPEAALFGEATGFVCEVRGQDAARFEAMCAQHGVAAERLGAVTGEPRLRLAGDGRCLVEADLASLARAWARGLDRALRGRSEA